MRTIMWRGLMSSTVLIGVLALAAPPILGGQARPAQVTDKAIARGERLYLGKGQCAGCHGQKGEGSEVGEPLVTGTWKLGDGGFDWLVHVIRHSGIAARGRDGDPQPMRGPTLLSDREVRSVAAYVWSISRNRAPKSSP